MYRTKIRLWCQFAATESGGEQPESLWREKPMSLLDWLATGYLAKRAHNAVSRPTVIMEDPEYELVGLKAKGMSEWQIRYRKKGQSSTDLVVVSRNTTHTSAGGGISINWP